MSDRGGPATRAEEARKRYDIYKATLDMGRDIARQTAFLELIAIALMHNIQSTSEILVVMKARADKLSEELWGD